MYRQFRSRWPTVATVMALACNPIVAWAGPLTVTCASEDTFVQGWTSPLTVTYSGGASGEIGVKSDHVAYTLHANRVEKTVELQGKEVPQTIISGVGEVPSIMPDPNALMTCVANSIEPQFKNDQDRQAQALLDCASKVGPATSPIAVHAEASIILMPIDDPNVLDALVVTKRRYLDVKGASGDNVMIETFPKDCELSGQ
jgi:hypothetical protein